MGKASCTKKRYGCNTMPMTLGQTLLVEIRRYTLWISYERFAEMSFSTTIVTEVVCFKASFRLLIS